MVRVFAWCGVRASVWRSLIEGSTKQAARVRATKEQLASVCVSERE